MDPSDSRLKPSLLDIPIGRVEIPTSLGACLNAHGLYNTEQFVLRLSPEVHRKIQGMPSGIIEGSADFDQLRAYSTYLHETIHWWQHIGSTTGLLLSLSYPGQSHANYNHVKSLLDTIGPMKSIRKFVEASNEPSGPDTPQGLANVIVNNYYDIEFFRFLVMNPQNVSQAVNDPYFDCVGHCYKIAYGNIALILASSIDNDLTFVPDPRPWSIPFGELRSEKAIGYYWRSNVKVVPIGAHHIFEGQARFGQLQFLYFASGNTLSWDDVRAMGMLDGIYSEAFDHFLRLAELGWPSSIDDPVVGLFLLVCDIAINPGAGFPLPIRSFSTFIEDVDPGIRFCFLCRAIARHCPEVARAIREYSRAEYEEVSDTLCRHLLMDSPLKIASTICQWANEGSEIKSLMSEHQTFSYGPRNLPVRLIYAHFTAFCADKLSNPEFFCWPGAWKTGERATAKGLAMFERNSAPFVDRREDGGVYPRIMPSTDEAVVQSTFDMFYAMNSTYDLTRQWIIRPGRFKYDYRWLSSNATPEIMKGVADRHFEQAYGTHPDAFEIL